MLSELKNLAIRFVFLLIATPLMGYVFLTFGEHFEKLWKSNNRKKRWLGCCGLFFLIAGISGWLQ